MTDTNEHSIDELTLTDITPILFGAAAFQYLNAACKLGLFELLHKYDGLSRAHVGKHLGLEDRAVDILLLGTTSLRLTRVSAGMYRNAPVIADLFTGSMWDTFASVVDFEADIVYDGQGDLTESLRRNTNVGLRRIPGTGRDLYHRFAENPGMEDTFYRYMDAWSRLGNSLLLNSVDFADTRTVLDVGGGSGVNAIALAEAHEHLRICILEIPATAAVARREIAARGLADRIEVREFDFLADPLPTGWDCILFAHQLVIWTPDENVALLTRAHDALAPGGRTVILNSFSNENGDGPLMAALDSAYFAALPAEGGMIYGWHQYDEWLRQAGFTRIERSAADTWTPHGVLVATRD